VRVETRVVVELLATPCRAIISFIIKLSGWNKAFKETKTGGSWPKANGIKCPHFYAPRHAHFAIIEVTVERYIGRVDNELP
jgi:hypothetical protein